MSKILAGLAAAAATAFPLAPALAEHGSSPRFVSPPSGQSVRLGGDHRRRHRGTVVVVGAGPAWPSEGWALYNNRSWEADSYNDWWHDRPDRAYPRWVQESRGNLACTEDRMWWSGAGWRC